MEEIESCVPPGFRFHPTEEELVGFYLNRKVNSLKFDIDVITDLDLYRMEPWDIQERCKLGYDEQNEWYFFSHKDRKYPTGTRTNRATAAGFWKATGRDKAVLSKDKIIGMRKTLVFYKGRAPNGRKSDWIMHEYRLQTSEHAPPQEEGWVVCRAFKKPIPIQKPTPWNYPPHYNYFTPTNTNIYHPHPPQPFEHHDFVSMELAQLPPLDSPSPANLAMAHDTLGFDHHLNHNEDYDEGKITSSSNNNNNNKWDVLDETSSFFNSNLARHDEYVGIDAETSNHDQVGGFLGCFSNL